MITEKDLYKVDSDRITEIIKKIVENPKNLQNLQKNSGEYPLISKQKDFKKFKSSFIEFWNRLVEIGDENLVTDEYLINLIFSWAYSMSLSPIRSLRHTATVIILNLSRAIINLIKSTQSRISGFEKQTNAAKTRNKNKIDQSIKKLSQSIPKMEDWLQKIWDNFLVERWSDSLTEIRFECVTAIGFFISEYPSVFLKNNCLKYLGWMFSDQEPSIRCQATKVWLDLYSNEDLRHQLNQFCRSLKKRLLNLYKDVDLSTAVQGFKVILFLHQNDPSLFDEGEFEETLKMISHENNLIRQAAIEVVLSEVLENPISKSKKTKKTKTKKGIEHVKIQAFLNFIEQNTLHPNYPNYVVDAIWIHDNSFLLDWETITNLMASEKNSSLPASQQLLLAKIMVCVARKLNSKSIVENSKLPNAQTRKKQENKIVDFTNQIVVQLHPLLELYKAEPLVLEQLVYLPQYFNLKIISEENKPVRFLINVKLLQNKPLLWFILNRI